MSELQFQSESSSLFDFPHTEDFNHNAPVLHDPEFTTQLPSHSYPHDSPHAPPFPPRGSNTPSTNRHLPEYMNSLTYAYPLDTLPEHAYFLHSRTMSHYDSAPVGDLTDFATSDYNTWHSDQGILRPCTSTTGTVEQTLVHPAHPRDSYSSNNNRYHPYTKQRPYEGSLVRFDTSYPTSSQVVFHFILIIESYLWTCYKFRIQQSFESTSSPSEPELPLLWRSFKPKFSDPRPPGFHKVSLTDLQTSHVLASFRISPPSAICYKRNPDTDTHTYPLPGCMLTFTGTSFRKHFNNSKFHPELNTKSDSQAGNLYCTVKSYPKVRCAGEAVHTTCFAQHFQLMHSLKECLCPFCLEPQRNKRDVVQHLDTCSVLSGWRRKKGQADKGKALGSSGNI
ncbi:hypothetical protein EDD18DRAFT_1111030 [Armillaria luteobubalina]|uniref:Uncharacterized protein n=1 Tax=Armillaria luteobubalina TaxID=153913 RepID=A0AA39UGU7_9AGAR|nr:hypothetical protein EDD18DRAFT_1111030 [Armillaria luteobubalina]